MPELPEVESVVCALNEISLPGKRLTSLEIICPKIAKSLADQLAAKRLIEIRRRGKYIHFQFDQNFSLIVHLRMTGQFLLKAMKDPVAKHERLIFNFEKKLRLGFHDTRRFATFELTTSPQLIFDKLGFEPLDRSVSGATLQGLLTRHHKAIKLSLLDQTIFAGIGNIYADEALWEAEIHPLKPSSSLKEQESGKLLQSVRNVLVKGIENGGTSLGFGASHFHHLKGQAGENQKSLAVYGRENAPCQRCGNPIAKIRVGQRGTHFCPRCQK
jgi:formamidopyrimidine-DNA glycosylase